MMYALLRSVGSIGGGAFKIANARRPRVGFPKRVIRSIYARLLVKCVTSTHAGTRVQSVTRSCGSGRCARPVGWLVGLSLSLCLRVRILRSVLFGYWTLLGCIGHCASVCCSPLKRSVQAYKHKRVRVCVRYFV